MSLYGTSRCYETEYLIPAQDSLALMGHIESSLIIPYGIDNYALVFLDGVLDLRPAVAPRIAFASRDFRCTFAQPLLPLLLPPLVLLACDELLFCASRRSPSTAGGKNTKKPQLKEEKPVGVMLRKQSGHVCHGNVKKQSTTVSSKIDYPIMAGLSSRTCW